VPRARHQLGVEGVEVIGHVGGVRRRVVVRTHTVTLPARRR
jgi:hypothetical protein